MKRERAKVVLVAVVCVLAVAAAAATLASPATKSTTDAGGDSLQSDADADTDGDAGESTADPIGSPGGLSFDIGGCYPWLFSAPFWTAVAIVATTIWFLVRYRMDTVAASASIAVLALPFTFVWLLLTNCGTQADEPRSIVPSDLNVTPEGGNASYGLFGDGALFGAPVWLLAIVAAIGIGAVAIAAARTPDDADDPEEASAEAVEAVPPGDVAGIGEIAGRAADRIERSAAVDNEIYRAWIEMTEHLDVDHPESSTPGEFQLAAIDAGVDDETVAELTELFERVRYGHELATTEREARALAALRAVESQADDLEAFWGDPDDE